MNSKTYNQTTKEVSQKLNKYFNEFCAEHPQYAAIKKEYTKKNAHLNGAQFYLGFASGPLGNWEDYIEVAIVIELVMQWAYKTKWILDNKADVWESEESMKKTILEHDLILLCINDLLNEYVRKGMRHVDHIRTYIDELMGKLSYGFWLERETLNVNYVEFDKILPNWEENYMSRNICLNLVYDYAPLIGYALSSKNFDIVDKYLTKVPDHLRFSHASQLISDLGDFGQHIDRHVRAEQDFFSDVRNGVVTFPVFKLREDKIAQKGLNNPKEVKSGSWQKKISKLISESDVNKDAIRIAAESFNAHKQFFEEHLENPNPMLLRAFGMLINNKYFDQKVVFEESPVLRSRVVLCDAHGKETGTEDKLKAHKKGKLHKAFSIFVYNSRGEHLIQKRADGKYHSAGLWSNTCCSHNISGERLQKTAQRRLREEMGFECHLDKKFSFVYKLDLGEGLCEHEYDTVLVGKYDGQVLPNPAEVSEVKWINIKHLLKDIKENPDAYTPWFKLILERMGYRWDAEVSVKIKAVEE
ncbi:MAG TPA: isopentenyl-diphosphate Delta-isomerase [Patescibacteria group bacterium]